MKAGAARRDITPPIGIPLAGTGTVRLGTHVEERLHVRALVLEQNGLRHAIVTADVLGFSSQMVVRVRRYCQKSFDIEGMLFNASHTHSGPNVCWNWTIGETASIKTRRLAYQKEFERKLREVVAVAVQKLRPVVVRNGEGQAHFGINRRVKIGSRWEFRPNPEGFHDKTVSVLEFASPTGKPLAILFSHACHPTTRYDTEISTDFPGVACRLIEARTKAVALFVQGACAEIRPKITKPGGQEFRKGTRADVNREGRELAGEVQRILRAQMTRLEPVLAVSELEVALPFSAPLRPGQLQEFDHSDLTAEFKQAWVSWMRRGNLPKALPMPMLLMRLSEECAILATGHELCNGYVPLLQALAGKTKLIVLGYTNDYRAYIPTRNILREGGYEGDLSLYVFLLPAKFRSSVETILLRACRRLLRLNS
jgi:neutral ceramidase